MRVLIIGGTRFIGRAAARILLQRGHAVTVFHRGQTPLPPELQGANELLGDRLELLSHAGQLRDGRPDVVLHMTAFTESDADLAQSVFEGYAERCVLISSCDVYRAFGVLWGSGEPEQAVPIAEDDALRGSLYPFRGAEPRAEDDPRRFLDDYDKILVERRMLESAQLPTTVLRLPMVYGPHDAQHRMYPYLRRMADGRPAILLSPRDATRRFARGYVDNVAQAIALAVEAPISAGRIYNVADKPTLTERDWIRHVAAAMGWPGAVVELPEARLPEHLRGGVDTDQELVVSTSKLRAELGFAEVVPLDDAIGATVAWERENYPDQSTTAAFDYAAEDAALAKLP